MGVNGSNSHSGVFTQATKAKTGANYTSSHPNLQFTTLRESNVPRLKIPHIDGIYDMIFPARNLHFWGIGPLACLTATFLSPIPGPRRGKIPRADRNKKTVSVLERFCTFGSSASTGEDANPPDFEVL